MSDEYSEYELVAPDWLNENYCENILKESEKDDQIKVTSLDITPACVNNDHYGSLMYRAKIKYNSSNHQNLTKSIVIKTMPDQGTKMDMLEGASFIFKTEIRVYLETIPKMEAILRKYGDDTVLGAKVLYAAMEPHQTIIFEDLVEKGFKTLRNRMPNREEVERALMKIAKWHALSFILAKEEPESITTYNDGTFSGDLSKFDFFTDSVRCFTEKILTSDDELKKYIPIFEKLNDTTLNECANIWHAHKRGDKAVFVLNHGDFHFRNMMFRHKDSGELDDVMLIDFQTCYYGPAVADVMYSTYMILDHDMRYNQRDEFIYYYYKIFADSLRKFEFKGEIPKMADFQIDFIKYRALEIFSLAGFLPFTALFVDSSVKLDKAVESQEERTKLLLRPALIAEVKRTLPRYLHKGILE